MNFKNDFLVSLKYVQPLLYDVMKWSRSTSVNEGSYSFGGGSERQKQGWGGDLIVATVAKPVVNIVGGVAVLVVDPRIRNTSEVVYIVWSTVNHFDVNIPTTTS